MTPTQYILLILFALMVVVFCIGIYMRQIGLLYGVETVARITMVYFVAVAAVEIARILKQ